MSKVGIMGGTFNPIHIGHLILAEKAYNQCRLDKVVFIPSGCPAYKDESVILPGNIRMEITRKAIENNTHFCVSDLEIKRDGLTFTVDTLRIMKSMNNDDELYFIMGADSINTIHEWHDYEEIFPLCTILVALRAGEDNSMALQNIEKLKNRYGTVIERIEMPLIDISSTEIRSEFINEMSVRYSVPDEVNNFLNAHREQILESWK